MVMELGMGLGTIPNVRMIVVIAMTVLTNPTCGMDRVLTLHNIEYSPKNKLKNVSI